MRQTRIRKRRSRPASRRQEPLRLDARDPDIVKAHQLARNPGSQGPPTAARVETTAAVLGLSLVYDVMLIAIVQSGALGGPRGWHRSAKGALPWPAT